MAGCTTWSEGWELPIPLGCVLIFRGDFVHAGAEYLAMNVRIHYFVDTDSFERVPDNTEPC
jgi:hypothetical protein